MDPFKGALTPRPTLNPNASTAKPAKTQTDIISLSVRLSQQILWLKNQVPGSIFMRPCLQSVLI